MSSDAPARSAANRPNLLIVFPDQMRAQAMGFMGADPVLTPNLDRLADESRVLVNAVSTNPLCSPYRASLLTGKYPYGHGVITNANSWGNRFGAYLKPHERCLGDVLRDAGYACGYIGKWHLDPPDAPPAEDWTTSVWDAYTPPGPRRHGFDFWHAYGCENNHLRPSYDVDRSPPGARLMVDQWSPEHEADVACDFIRNAGGSCRPAGRPFALLVSMNPPHTPYAAVPERYRRLYAGADARDLLTRPNVRLDGDGRLAADSVRDYFAAVTGVDEQVGRILDCLSEQGLERDTIVVFTADHGDMMGSQGRMYKNVWYEESFVVPFLIRWTGRIRPGRDRLHLAPADLMPSLLGLMNLADRTPDGVEGADHSAVLLGRSDVRPASAFYMFPTPYRPTGGARGVRTDRYTFVMDRFEGAPGPILYDNEADPFQMRNVAAAEPARVAKLTAELNRWLAHTLDPWGRCEFPEH